MFVCFFVLMIRRPPRSTLDRSSAASDVYKRQAEELAELVRRLCEDAELRAPSEETVSSCVDALILSLIHISEPTRPD